MCEALEQIYLEVHGERLEREKQKAIDEAVAKAVSVAVAEAEAEKDASLAEKDISLAEKDISLAEKDTQLNREKELNQKLLARIAELESQIAKQNL